LCELEQLVFGYGHAERIVRCVKGVGGENCCAAATVFAIPVKLLERTKHRGNNRIELGAAMLPMRPIAFSSGHGAIGFPRAAIFA